MNDTTLASTGSVRSPAARTFGRVVFGLALIVFGLQCVLHFVVGFVPALGPPFAPSASPWMYVNADISIVVGLLFVAGIQVRRAALALSVLFTLRIALVYGPQFVTNIRAPGPWTSAFELLSMVAASLVLASFVRPGRLLFALTLIVYGVQHFQYAAFVAKLIPAWIPWALFWAYAVGVAFFAAAIAIVAHRLHRTAAILLSLMFLIFLVLLHVPRAMAAVPSGNEWTSTTVALAMCGASLLMAVDDDQPLRAPDSQANGALA